MELLALAIDKIAPKSRYRQWLIIFLRLSILFLLIFVFAKPKLPLPFFNRQLKNSTEPGIGFDSPVPKETDKLTELTVPVIDIFYLYPESFEKNGKINEETWQTKSILTAGFEEETNSRYRLVATSLENFLTQEIDRPGTLFLATNRKFSDFEADYFKNLIQIIGCRLIIFPISKNDISDSIKTCESSPVSLKLNRSHPITRELVEYQSFLDRVAIDRFCDISEIADQLTEPTTSKITLIATEDGTPFVSIQTSGAGEVVQWNSSLATSRNNLASNPLLPVFLNRLVLPSRELSTDRNQSTSEDRQPLTDNARSFILCLLAAIVILFFLEIIVSNRGRREPLALATILLGNSVIIRLSLLLGILFYATDPQMMKQTPSGTVTIFVDRSASMNLTNNNEISRIDSVKNLLNEEFIRSLKQHYQLRLFSYDIQLSEPIESVSSISSGEAITAVGDSCWEWLDSNRSEKNSGILLFSDGVSISGMNDELFLSTVTDEIPITTIAVGAWRTDDFLRWKNWSVPPSGRSDEMIPIEFQLNCSLPWQGNRPPDNEINGLNEKDYYLICLKIFTLPTENFTAEKTYHETINALERIITTEGNFVIDSTGIFFESANRTSNNQCHFTFSAAGENNVIHGSLEIPLLLEGNYLAQIQLTKITNDTNDLIAEEIAPVRIYSPEISVLVIANQPNRDSIFLKSRLNRLDDMKIDFRDHSNLEITQELLNKYQIVMIIDPNRQDFRESDLAVIDQWVADKSGSLIITAGKNLIKLINEQKKEKTGDSIINSFYPFYFSEPTTGDNRLAIPDLSQSRETVFHKTALTPDGESSSFFDPELIVVWQSFPGVATVYPSLKLKPAARLIAYALPPNQNDSESAIPVIASHDYGTGNLFFIGTDEIWRIRQIDEEAFDRFWSNLFRYLHVMKNSRKIEVADIEILLKSHIEIEKSQYVNDYFLQEISAKTTGQFFRFDEIQSRENWSKITGGLKTPEMKKEIDPFRQLWFLCLFLTTLIILFFADWIINRRKT